MEGENKNRPAMSANEPKARERELLLDLKLWLERHRRENVINRNTGKGGHNGDGNSWSAVAIPEWDVRQRLDEIDAALKDA